KQPTVPQVECGQHYPTLAVSDVIAAAEFYTNKLGFTLGFTWGDPPVRAGVNLGDVSVHLALGTPNPQWCSLYCIVGAADELYEFHRAKVVEIVASPADRPWGLRDYKVR